MITGASAGIGEACAKIFAQQGYKLLLVARRKDKLAELADSLITEYGVKVKVLALDVRDKEQVKVAWESLPKQWQLIDVLINNAGLSQGLDPIVEGDWEDWDRMVDTNIKGLLYISRVVLPGMRDRKKGHVINIGSIAAKEVYPNGNVYCATKHAVDALSKGMRIELLPYQVKVSTIHPGAVETEFSIVRFKGDEVRAKQVYEGFCPLFAADIADAVWYVVSRPEHVNINDLLIMPTAQASATIIEKK